MIMEIETETAGQSDEPQYVSITVEYLAELIQAKKELRELKAQMPDPLPDGAPYLLREGLAEWQGMDVDDWLAAYPEDVEYRLYEERGDC